MKREQTYLLGAAAGLTGFGIYRMLRSKLGTTTPTPLQLPKYQKHAVEVRHVAQTGASRVAMLQARDKLVFFSADPNEKLTVWAPNFAFCENWCGELDWNGEAVDEDDPHNAQKKWVQYLGKEGTPLTLTLADFVPKLDRSKRIKLRIQFEVSRKGKRASGYTDKFFSHVGHCDAC